MFSSPSDDLTDALDPGFDPDFGGSSSAANFLTMGAKAFGQSMTDKDRQYFNAPTIPDRRSVKDIVRGSPTSKPADLTPTQRMYQNERVRQYGLSLANSSNDHVKNAFAAAGLDRVQLTSAIGRRTVGLSAPKLKAEVDVQ
jgi:hypothetical protein